MSAAHAVSVAGAPGPDAAVIDCRAGLGALDAVPDARRLAGERLSALLPPVSSPATSPLLDACLSARIGTIILCGTRNGTDLQHLDVLLQVAEARGGVSVGTTRIVAMAGDNPHGLLAAASFADKSRRLVALGWDREALAASMGLKTGLGADVTSAARATLLLAAAAANVVAIDTAEPNLDAAAFQTGCTHAKAQGFWGKMTGNPLHLPVIQSVFAD